MQASDLLICGSLQGLSHCDMAALAPVQVHSPPCTGQAASVGSGAALSTAASVRPPCQTACKAASDTRRTHTPLGQPTRTPTQAAALRAKRARGVPIKTLREEYDISKATVFRYLAEVFW
jgi:hypothetical protein